MHEVQLFAGTLEQILRCLLQTCHPIQLLALLAYRLSVAAAGHQQSGPAQQALTSHCGMARLSLCLGFCIQVGMGLGVWSADKESSSEYNLVDPHLRDTTTVLFNGTTQDQAAWVAFRYAQQTRLVPAAAVQACCMEIWMHLWQFAPEDLGVQLVVSFRKSFCSMYC